MFLFSDNVRVLCLSCKLMGKKKTQKDTLFNTDVIEDTLLTSTGL